MVDKSTGETLFSTTGSDWETALTIASSGLQEITLVHTSGSETGWFRVVSDGATGDALPILAGPYAYTARYGSPFNSSVVVLVKGTGMTNVHIAGR